MRTPQVLKHIVGVMAVIVVWQFVMRPALRNTMGFDEIEWRGEKFKLKQKYLDYEEYKSDIDQLAANEVERVKRFMLALRVPLSTRSEADLRQSLRQMRFPGFGSSSAGAVKDEHGDRYILNEYEIPQKHERRTLLYRVEPDGSCRLVVDGVSVDHLNDHTLGNREVKVEDGKLRHYFDSKVYREIALETPR
ncbi:MAG: hypothetical protein AB1813_19725 [Verrucomicrobiota bacterium]